MQTYLDAIDLGHLNKTVKDNGLTFAFFLQLTPEDLQTIGIGPVQAKKIMMCMPPQ